MSYLRPLWKNLLKLRLGRQSDLQMSSILFIFNNKGACRFDLGEQSERKAALTLNKDLGGEHDDRHTH